GRAADRVATRRPTRSGGGGREHPVGYPFAPRGCFRVRGPTRKDRTEKARRAGRPAKSHGSDWHHPAACSSFGRYSRPCNPPGRGSPRLRAAAKGHPMRLRTGPPRRGVAAIEMGFVTMLFVIPLIIGIWEVGRMIHVQQVVANAAREGARLAA